MSTLPRTLGEALAWARGHIDGVDARVLLRKAAGVSAATLAGFAERELPLEAAKNYVKWVSGREAGEPIAYLTGEREFYGRVFKVTSDTLIPRPETELLVELALEKLRGVGSPRILDLGTGTGAIAITLALQSKNAFVIAVDASPEALTVTQENARALGATVCMRCGNWFESVAGEQFDLIVSNPPYVAVDDPHLAQGDVRFEPRTALVGGADGLDDIRRIVTSASAHLLSGSWLMLEHGYNQAAQVRDLFAAAGFGDIQSWSDLAGIERVTGGQWISPPPGLTS
ncbi:MAG TPA: peptide chain release factor N(5)-glutamine methyltransferase [Rhodocyclaceae bacterium]|nr:peptide chain release factor N(5)-glutamine methyltransferase [Rhodocyclaceae bacterium]